jgi:CTP:phosphocholine cytidylyltransferase-like protein
MYAKLPAEDFLDANRLWKDFRACQADIKNELKLINCTESFINSKITRYEKGKLASMLIMGFSFSDLQSCDGVKNLLPEAPLKGEKYFCMNVLGNTSKLPGYIAVSIEKGQMKLNAIKYNEGPSF